MHSNIFSPIFWPMSYNNIQKIFYLLFALVLLFDEPLCVRGGYPTAELRKGLNNIRYRMQELAPSNDDLDEFLEKRAAALLPYSGGIYGKRAAMPYSGGIYGKRAAMPFSGGIYGKRSSLGKTSEFALNYPNNNEILPIV